MSDQILTDPNDSKRATGVSLLFGLAAAVIVLAGLSLIRDIFAVAFLAMTLAVTVRPLFTWLVERRVPRVVASMSVSALVLAFIFGLVALIGLSIVQLVEALPSYASEFSALYREAVSWLETLGIEQDAIGGVLASLDFNSVFSTATGLLTGLGQGSWQLVTLLIIIAFIGVDATRITSRVEWLRRDEPSMLSALMDFGVRVRQYWIVSTSFGLLVAILDTIFLSVVNVPLAFTWGVLAFVTNYVPNVGFVLGLIPPALMALLAGDVTSMVIVIVGYSVINFFFQTIIQPKFTGDAVGLNTTVTFVSLLFWVPVVGGLGALMAVPLTLFFKAVFIDSSRRTSWLGVFMQAKDTHSEAPPERVTNPLRKDITQRKPRVDNSAERKSRLRLGVRRRNSR